MENKQINQLMLAMGKTGITELVLKREGFELQLKRGEKVPMRSFDGFTDNFEENPMHVDFEKQRAQQAVVLQKEDAKGMSLKEKAHTAKEDEMSIYVTSPMVGTIYYTPSPNDPAFVKVGDRVEKNTVVCIIEAMKVMNEIKAQVAGTVAEILIENGSPVEFGTKIFRITPT